MGVLVGFAGHVRGEVGESKARIIVINVSPPFLLFPLFHSLTRIMTFNRMLGLRLLLWSSRGRCCGRDQREDCREDPHSDFEG